jgi:type IV secretion system protein VirD4
MGQVNRRIRIGYSDKTCRERLYYPGDAHVTLVAPSGAGKGRDLLIPALLEFEGSCVVIDPKGQLAACSGPHRARMGQRVFVLNPFNILAPCFKKLTSAGYNPLGVLDPKAASFGADCDALAEGIVLHESGSEGSHWTDSARQLVSGVVMMLAKYAPLEKRNLVELYQVITGPSFFEFARAAIRTRDTLICGRLGRFVAHAAEENRELLGIISTAITQCGFIGNQAIATSLFAEGPELRFASLRDTRTTVYLVLPTKYLATCGKWFRLVIAAAMADLLREDRGRFPVLALLDEFAQLGALKVMADIMGIGRGYNVQIWPVLQDLSQLEELYPKKWQTFLGNSGAQIFFAPRDLKTAEYMSQKCGETEVMAESRSVGEMAFGPRDQVEHISVNTSYGPAPRKYLLPHEAAELPGDEMLVFGENLAGVIRAGRKPYWRMPECRGKFAPDPYHAK